jgi:hypothetical protein
MTQNSQPPLESEEELTFDQQQEIDRLARLAYTPSSNSNKHRFNLYAYIAELRSSRDQQIALATEIQRLETGAHVAFQIIDGASPHELHTSFNEQLIKLEIELATLNQTHQEEKEKS